jgi:hypothetical protein
LKNYQLLFALVFQAVYHGNHHKEGLITVDNNGKSIDEVFGSENEERKMQSVENWIKFVKRPLPKCFPLRPGVPQPQIIH